MLFECSCDATQTLVADAIQKGFALRPKSNTPLCELVKTTTVVPMTDLTAKLGQEQKAVPIEELIADANNQAHNNWQDEVTERAAAIVNRRIEVIRTNVIPAIREISESVTAAIQHLPTGAVLQNIERYVACDMMNVPNFMARVKQNTPQSYLSPDEFFTQPPQSQAVLMEMLKLGGATLDAALGMAINHVGADNLWLLWESLFVDRSKCTAENYMTFDQAVMHSEFGLDFAILIFVFTDLVENESVSTCRQYREAASYWITRHTNNYQKEVADKKLIRTRNNERGAIVVNGLVYTEFLQRQGTAEMVIGAAASEGRYFTLESILENQKECLRQFNLLKASLNVESTSKLSAAFRTSFRQAFMRSFKNDRSDAEAGYFEKHPGDESLVISKFEEQLPLLSASSLADINRNIAYTLCTTRFFYMDCLCFLKAVDQCCENGMEPAEAETQATLSEIVRFVVSMITH